MNTECILKKRPCLGTQISACNRRSADSGGYNSHTARIKRALRGLPRSKNSGRSAHCGSYAVGQVYNRPFLPDKAIDLVDEACALIRCEIDSMPTELDDIQRKIMQLEIEEQAIKKRQRSGRQTFTAAKKSFLT